MPDIQLPFTNEEIEEGIQGGLDSSKVTISVDAPETPETNDIWIRTTDYIPFVYNVDTWIPLKSGLLSDTYIPTITYSETSPLDPDVHDLWIKAGNLKLYSYLPPYWVQM